MFVLFLIPLSPFVLQYIVYIYDICAYMEILYMIDILLIINKESLIQNNEYLDEFQIIIYLK